MNFFGITHLINGILSFLLGSFVICQDLKSKLYRSYALLCLSLSFWCISYFIWQLQASEQSAIFWLKILMAFMAYIHSFFLHFTLSNIGLIKEKRNILWFSYSWSIIFSLLFLSGIGFSTQGGPKLFSVYWPDANIFTLTFLIVQIFIILFALHCLYSSIKESSKDKQNKIKYIFFMSILAWGGGLTNWFLWFNIPIPPIGNPIITIYLAVMAYAILRHHLLDIKIIFKKTIIYSILASIITILYFGIILILENVFRIYYGYKSFPISFTVIIFFLFLFQPLKNYIQRIIDKYFFRGSIDQINEENIKLRNELQKTEKLKAVATLAAGMAHEIKNPLTSIKTFTEYLPKKKNDPEFVEQFQKIVGGEVDRINHTVKQLLEFSKPSELNVQEVKVNDLLDETLDFLNNDFLKHNIKIEKTYSPMPLVAVDPSLMKQVFLNLLLNSIESMKGGGSIAIATGMNGNNKISIKVSDTGKGIDKNDLKHIFDPFFSKKDGGTGLGLSVVHGIVEKHKGKITVESAPGIGTSIEINLPFG